MTARTGKLISVFMWFASGLALGFFTYVATRVLMQTIKCYIPDPYMEFAVCIPIAINIGCCIGALNLTISPSTSIRSKSIAATFIGQMINTLLEPAAILYISSLYVRYALAGVIGAVNGYVIINGILSMIENESEIDCYVESDSE